MEGGGGDWDASLELEGGWSVGVHLFSLSELFRESDGVALTRPEPIGIEIKQATGTTSPAYILHGSSTCFP
jgi:hypothetical protein